jgi:prevent-host-death family protein
MRTFGLFEARRKLPEIVEHAARGESVGITREGKLVAIVVPARPESSLRDIFADIEAIRKHTKRPGNFKVKHLIEEGRI